MSVTSSKRDARFHASEENHKICDCCHLKLQNFDKTETCGGSAIDTVAAVFSLTTNLSASATVVRSVSEK
jgi:hypothetical protein